MGNGVRMRELPSSALLGGETNATLASATAVSRSVLGAVSVTSTDRVPMYRSSSLGRWRVVEQATRMI